MKQLWGLARLVLTAVVLGTGVLIVLVAGLLPLRIRRRRPAAWVAMGMARLFNRLYNIQVVCPAPTTLRHHRGFIFPNHLSFLDVVVLQSLMPTRFLSMAAVRNYPLIGWLAVAIGTIFVVREDDQSRRQARDAIVQSYQQEADPPIVLFPEGKLGPGDRLLPFRHGAFEMAVEHGIAFVPCVLKYTPLAVALWRSGTIVGAVWQLAQMQTPLRVEVTPLAVVQPQPGDDPVVLAQATQQAMEKAFGS